MVIDVQIRQNAVTSSLIPEISVTSSLIREISVLTFLCRIAADDRAGVASDEQGDAMRLVRKAALAAGSGALTLAFGGLAVPSMPTAAVAAVQVVPFAAGHVVPLAKGKMSQPPTTAQCEANYGIACYQPFQLQRAYDLAPLFSRGIEGQGETIVIVDAFGSPSIASDLQTFDAETGLPNPPSFQVITPEGPITTNSSNCTSVYSPGGPDLCSDYYGWTDETSLDVEWSHVMAPKANILLVETPMTETEGIYGFPQIVAAENYVIDHHLGDVISQSFGANEQTFTSPAQIYSLRSANINAERNGVTMLTGSGDDGATSQICDPSSGCANPDDVTCCSSTRTISWPASDPLVTAVGGTQLQLNAEGDRTAPDSVWNDLSSTIGIPGPVFTWGSSGGGQSMVFSRPQFQDGVAGVSGHSRSTPDISMSGAVNGAVDFYDTTDPSVAGWNIVGGTSESSPLFSGIVALADQVAGHSLGDLNPALYAMAERGGSDGIVPISQGSNSFTFCQAGDIQSNDSCASSSDLVTVPGFQANGSYNEATGWGTVDAALFVPALAHFAR
jgi:subtilase family serine protease